MGRVGKYILFVIMSLSAAVELSAQSRDTSLHINALDYSMQKRYRPKDEPFASGAWGDNTFVSIHLGAGQLAPFKNDRWSWGPSVSVSYGKWFNPFNALRATLGWDMFDCNTYVGRVHNAGLDVSYLFNISSYLGGYRRGRGFEIHTVTGLGYRMSFLEKDVTHVGNAHLGLHFNMKIGKRMSVFVEPEVNLYTNGIIHAEDLNWKRYNIGYGATVGLNYGLGTSPDTAPHKRKSEGMAFISLMGGAQFQNSDLVHEMGILKSVGPHAAVSAGIYYSDMFAMRTSLSYASDKWTEYDMDSAYKTHYASIRIEGLFDIVAACFRNRGTPAVTCSVAFGPEIGYMLKKDRTEDISKLYLGLAGGVQVKFRVQKRVSLFLEPRFSVVPYSLPVYPAEPFGALVRDNYYDSIYSLNAGVEIRL